MRRKDLQWEGMDPVSYTHLNLFFEPSTRTHYSFDTAALRLNCKTLNFDAEGSSLKKGESLYDTVKTFEMFGVDGLIIRHTDNEYYKDLVGKIKAPILNAGDGTGNHPSQSLLDLYTIQKQFGNFNGLKIAIVGDIRHSRVAHSNKNVMERLGMKVYCIAPKELRDENCVDMELDDVLEEMDIIMMLRVQRERHGRDTHMTKEEYFDQYGINMDRVKKMKENAIIMHPAPFNRGVEIADEVVECQKSRIFPQIRNGVYVRMAMIEMALEQ